MKMIKLAALAFAPFLAQPAMAATIVNGSFEAGNFAPISQQTMTLAAGDTDITGWTVNSDFIAWIGTGNPWNLSASEGDRFLDLTDYQNGAPFGRLSQTIATDIGATYEVSFDVGSSLQYSVPVAVEVSAGGSSTVFTTSNLSQNDAWETGTFTFTATSSTTELGFGGQSGTSYIGLDNVSISTVSAPVPLPASALLLLGALSASALGLRKRG